MNGTILGIKFEAIDRAIEHFEVPRKQRRGVFEKVVKLGRSYANQLQEDQLLKTPIEQRPKKTPVEPPPTYSSYEEMEAAEEIEDEDYED